MPADATPGLSEEFRSESSRLLRSYHERIASAVDRLSQPQLWWRPHPGTNAVGNLLLHLSGNLSQWVLWGLGGEAFERDRSAEFAASDGAEASLLLAQLGDVVSRCGRVIDGLDDAALARRHEIQGYQLSGLAALYHAVEHMSYHTGQIVATAKQLLGPEAGIEFYPQHRGE